jgi:glycosyltransferase involved in cell wall biosynthesis
MSERFGSDTPKVAVLIPTFQGVLFLEKQIKSVYDQENVDVDVYVCDDGSTDGTFELLNQLNSQFKFKVLVTSNRIGSNKVFFYLLDLVKGADFVAFCDQDDIWKSNKLITSIRKLNDENSDLVFSRREHIDVNGKNIGVSPRVIRDPSWANAAVENVAFGNTQVLSKKGYNLIRRIGFVDVDHFDSWVFLLIASHSKVSYIDKFLIQYRIHKGNQVGLRKFPDLLNFNKRLVNFEMQVDKLLRIENLVINDKASRGLNKFCCSTNLNMSDLFSSKSDWVFRQSALETILLRLWIFTRSYFR